MRTLSREIETAATRIHDLVGAVKGFTYMDHAPTPEPVDIRRGITDTLTMLGAKTRAKSVEVSVEFADDLPRAHAVGAELNQVWMNLIDNALDAVADGRPRRGDRRRGRCDASWCGSSTTARAFPPEIQATHLRSVLHDQGRGKGHRAGSRHRAPARCSGTRATIEVESVPGRTEFRVRVPMER